MPHSQHPDWLNDWMDSHGVKLWGCADLKGFQTPLQTSGQPFPQAISFALTMAPDIMQSIRQGPNQDYANEYAQVNERINQLSRGLAKEIQSHGFPALTLAASVRSDTVNIKGDFPHKTSATRAGLGWIGRHCQLITRPFGPWVRLGTVFVEMDLVCGTPMERSFCGKCRKCVDACPAGALTGGTWQAGTPRETLLDVRACDQWKKTHYMEFHNGHNCGICSSACPYGMKKSKYRDIVPK